MTVECKNCDNVETSSRRDGIWAWLCTKAPRPVPINYVDSSQSVVPPFYKCDSVNYDGNCPYFTPLPPKKGK